MTFFDRLNNNVARSRVGKHFRLEGSGARRERAGSKFTTEIRAGLTTFVTMVMCLSLACSHSLGFPHWFLATTMMTIMQESVELTYPLFMHFSFLLTSLPRCTGTFPFPTPFAPSSPSSSIPNWPPTTTKKNNSFHKQ